MIRALLMAAFAFAMPVAAAAPVTGQQAHFMSGVSGELPLSDEPTPFLIDNNSIVKITCGQWMGTGSYVGNGLIVTARHVVAGTAQCNADGAPVKIVETVPGLDYALVSIDTKHQVRQIIDCSGFHEGQVVLATGYAEDAQRTVTQRLIASNAVETGSPNFNGLTILRGSVTQGMSGGPINDLMTGALVGIINANTGDGITQALALPLSKTPLCK